MNLTLCNQEVLNKIHDEQPDKHNSKRDEQCIHQHFSNFKDEFIGNFIHRVVGKLGNYFTRPVSSN